MGLAFLSPRTLSARGWSFPLNTPICRTCAKPQHGVVEFRWSEGAVVYECKGCGEFNEVSEIVRHVRVRRPQLGQRPPVHQQSITIR
jgi:hypothetical protein